MLDEDLVTIQRYAGKTNEAFTHLLVNLALAAGDGTLERWMAGERLRLLDPVCGRGTTLNRAALHGIDALGIEIDQRDVAAYDTFLTTWLQDKRLKHTVERATLRKGRPTPAHRVTDHLRARRRTRPRTGSSTSSTTTAGRPATTTRRARSTCSWAICPTACSTARPPAAARSRAGPEAFLAEALPVWRDVLRPGGGVALAWNRRTLPRPAAGGAGHGGGPRRSPTRTTTGSCTASTARSPATCSSAAARA